MAKSKFTLIIDWIFDQFVYPLFETDVHERIAFAPAPKHLAPIPWPKGLAPTPASTIEPDGVLPAADALVITWTAAEAMALADVLTPGIHSTDWVPYKNNWATFEKHLTGRSPARESKRLGSFHMTRIGNMDVCCFKSELHPATDDATVPTALLAAQIANETGARLIITTGTAGGAGDDILLGDVNVATAVHADFTRKLSKLSWAHEKWPLRGLSVSQTHLLSILNPLFAANYHLPGAAHPPSIWQGDVVSTDFFAYDTEDDHFGLRKYDPLIRAVEMDDAAVAYGIGQDKTMFCSVRNASDPVMPDASKASAKQAAQIYRQYGYWTTVNSAIATWALIAGMQ